MDLAHFWNTSGAYEIKQSLRFNPADSARLYRTLAASQTRTYSFWYKYANLSGGNMYLFHHKNSGDTNYLGVRSGGSPSENQWQTLNQGSSFTQIFVSGVKFRDPSAWQHFVFKCTGSNVTQYINGVEYGSTGGANISLSGGTLEIGARGSAEYFGGYIAEFHFVDGTAYNPSDFGETDTITGAWIPKRFSGTYGSNGAYLKFDPSATNGIGHDHSGNGNNFTATGFSTSGTGTDVMSDTPTNNWCTLNPLDKNTSASAPSDGNLSWNQSSAAWYAIRGTVGVTSGKWYWETKLDSGLYGAIGIGNSRADLDGYSAESNVWSYVNNGRLEANGTGSVWGNTYTTGDVIGVALDADTGKLWFSKNGTWQESGDPSAGTNPAVSGLAADSYFPYFVHYQTTITANFGQRSFSYTPPSNFKALCTANLPEPTIKKGSKYFDTKLYTANNQTAQTVTGLGFSPDLLWFKPRSRAEHHYLYDQVRGAGNRVSSSQTIAEVTGDNSLTAFTSDGFSLGTDGAGIVNYGTDSMVAWAWDANGAGSSNTAGTITSTVSANASAGFSIVTYTGTLANATVGHGLGVAPSMIICKQRAAANDWIVYHSALGNTGRLKLNTDEANSTSSTFWNSTSPTSTVFSLGTSNLGNNTGTYVAYCFSEVAGYSKFGSYTGNGSSDGPFVFTNFKVKWLMVKRTDSTANWYMFDAARNTYNPLDAELDADLSIAETTAGGATFDFLSNGFKLRRTGNAVNNSGGNYIFAAFAEHPFKYANAR